MPISRLGSSRQKIITNPSGFRKALKFLRDRFTLFLWKAPFRRKLHFSKNSYNYGSTVFQYSKDLCSGTKKMDNEIRFGIICESLKLKAWEVECIEKTLSGGKAKLALIILPEQNLETKKIPFFHQLAKQGGYSKILFNLYERFILRPKYLAVVDCTDKFKDIPSLYYSTKQVAIHSEYFKNDDIEKIKNANLDFILLFSGIDRIPGVILNSASFGVWSYFHGDIKKFRGTPRGFWEICFNESVTGSVLYKLTSSPEEIIILREGFFRTDKFSYSGNLDQVLAGSTGFASEACQEIWNNLANQLSTPPLKIKSPIYEYPGNFQCINSFFKMFINKASNFFQNLFFWEQWNIGLINCSCDEFLDMEKNHQINWLLSPKKNEFFADPSVIKFKEKYYVLYEYFHFLKKEGVISAAVIEKNALRPIKMNCLEKAHHSSYPFVFEYKNDIYLLLEEAQVNRLVLYRSRNFPVSWEEANEILNDVPALDSTLFRHDNLWWLFFTRLDDNPYSKLFIYYSENLMGPWKPHKKNPVKTDVRSSRPAGSLFFYKGQLLRPSQDCSETYGGKIVFNRVITLSPDEFKEEPFIFLEAKRNEKFNKGIHTINAAGNMVVVDSKRHVFNLLQVANCLGLNLSPRIRGLWP